MDLTFVVVVALGAILLLFTWVSRKDIFLAGSVWLMLVLFHELMLRWIVNLAGVPPQDAALISLWKEAGLLGLGIGFLSKVRTPRSLPRLHLADWGLLGFFALGVWMALVSPNRVAGLAALRDYFEPMVLYALGRVVLPSRAQLRKWKFAWLAAVSLMAILAIWQGIAWDSAEYSLYGFGAPSGQSGIPEVGIADQLRIRPPSTVTGPNELAIHMVLAVIFSVSLATDKLRRNWVALGTGLVAIGALFLTASRSGFLALVAALIVLVWLSFGARRRSLRMSPWGWLAALAGALVVGLVVWLTGFGDLLVSTLSSLGRQYHFVDTADAIRYLVAHPGGVGMGLVGPRQGFGFPTVAAYHVEGSLFQIAMEMGVWGLAVFLAFLAMALRTAWQSLMTQSDPSLRAVTTVAIAGWVGALVAFLFLPLMQALPLMAWLWFLLGLACSAPKIEAAWQAGRRLSPQAAPTMPPPPSTG